VTPPSGTNQILDREDLELLERAQQWRPEIGLTSLTTAKLEDISKTNGIDFATAVLYDRIWCSPANMELAHGIRAPVASSALKIDLVGIVPGAFYRQHKNTGADGKRVLEISQNLGLKAEVIQVKSFGALAENAQIIAEWLIAHRSQTVMLVSLSKGSSDVKAALARPDAGPCFESVHSWISFSGVVQGTPLVGWLKSRPLRNFGARLLLRLQGHRPSTLDELRWGADAPLSTWPILPQHMNVVHIYGFPTKRHLAHPWAPKQYERLRSLGPNDGGCVLLGDLAQLPGIVWPVWAADHYLLPAWDISSLLQSIVLATVQGPRSSPGEPIRTKAKQSAGHEIPGIMLFSCER
jgi:hypothetical protein